MTLTLIALSGKLKPHEQAWVDVYVKRMRPYAKLELVVLKETQRSWETIQKRLSEKTYVVMLDERGERKSTALFKSLLEHTLPKRPSMTFLIGGAYGFPNEIQTRPDLKLSISDMTLPHRMVLLLLVEQIYRAFSMMRNHPYHHSD